MNQAMLNGGAGVVGAILSYAVGGWSEVLSFLLIAMVIDIITGVRASFAEGRGLSSAVGSAGLAKKGLIFLVVILSHRVDVLLELNDVTMSAAIYFYVANELVSIAENLGRAGVALPDKLADVIDVLKKKGGVKDGDNGKNV